MKELDCKYCFGCRVTTRFSNYFCSVTIKHIMTWCYHPSQGEVEGFGRSAMCCGCYDKRDGVPLIGGHTGVLYGHAGLGRQLEPCSTNACCCGCGSSTKKSTQFCIHAGRKVMETCCHPSQTIGQENDNKALYKGCFEKIEVNWTASMCSIHIQTWKAKYRIGNCTMKT
jgi:hypothetical protein